ncbi:hypothetical protein JBE04_41305 [Streptomyces sp. PRKS01-29]|nr:hypothetical protein [Streptomyces sabulosicollis]MBI0300723.1 hypothetical protein [Streptomyces sabulosicollis]
MIPVPAGQLGGPEIATGTAPHRPAPPTKLGQFPGGRAPYDPSRFNWSGATP